jgi:hypothetical protein
MRKKETKKIMVELITAHNNIFIIMTSSIRKRQKYIQYAIFKVFFLFYVLKKLLCWVPVAQACNHRVTQEAESKRMEVRSQ